VTAALVGSCSVPGDKSISHRAAILAALAPGTSRIRGFSPAGDCASTLSAVAALGARVEGEPGDGSLRIVGPIAPHGRHAGPDADADPGANVIDCGRAGTAMRLLAGVIASLPMSATLTGDRQLLRRPMRRVADPLRLMGAEVGLVEDERPPIHVSGGGLSGIDYRMPVASAQVKSAVLLAGLLASGRTTVREPIPTRDHTERMLAAMGARIGVAPGAAWVERGGLSPLDLVVPGDLSSAAFLLTAAAIVPHSSLTIEGVGLNPTRAGFLRILERMGGDVTIDPDAECGGEPAGSILGRHARLRATLVGADEVPSAIDELPLIGLLATQADGVTEVRGAGELRVKESDRIAGLVRGLRALGADAEELPDGFVVRGPTKLRGGAPDARDDHRLAMTFAIAGLIADGPVRVDGISYADDSFPGFETVLGELTNGART
jgi:3-phosphoshikimate 1-carboxyvinyltransferase